VKLDFAAHAGGESEFFVRQLEAHAEGAARRVHHFVHDPDHGVVTTSDRLFRHDGRTLLRLDLSIEADGEDYFDVQRVDFGELEDRASVTSYTLHRS